MKAHAFLPYRERHMEVLSCAVCHAAGSMGPAAEMVDATSSRPRAGRWCATGTSSSARATP